jgi:hypothetical protein
MNLRLPAILYWLLAAMALVGLVYIITIPAVYKALGISVAADTMAPINLAVGNGLSAIWRLLRPLIQLAVLLIIVSWFLERLGVSLNLENFRASFNVQAVLAILVVGSFCLTALIGISIDGLKELALVIVGFYFGSRARKKDRPYAPPPSA